jgi:protein-S-isoprenylcysteine O-methyltransferase Ste14
VKPLPYTDSGAKVVFYVLVGVWVASELRVRFVTRGNQRGATREWGSFIVVIACFYLGLAGGFTLASRVESAAIGFARPEIFVLGALLTAAGIAFRQWAIAVLGAWFTVEVRVSEDQTVVESGPYAWVAHPAYTGLVAVFLGIGLMLGNWLSLACLAIVPTIALVVRIKVEERELAAVIGEPYRRFLAGRARLIPRVW